MKAFISVASPHIYSRNLVSAENHEKYEAFLNVHKTTFRYSEQKHVLIKNPRVVKDRQSVLL